MSYAALIRSYRSFSNSITDFTAPAIEQLLAGNESRHLRERSASTNETAGERAVSTRPTSALQPTSSTSDSLAHQQSVPVAGAVPSPPPPPPPPTRERLESDARSVSPAISVAIAVDSDYSPSAETAHNEFVSCLLLHLSIAAFNNLEECSSSRCVSLPDNIRNTLLIT